MPLRQLNVSAEWVATGDTGELRRIMRPDVDGASAREWQGSVAFMFPELEFKDVRIFDMPGVVDWIGLVHERIPHLIYFLEPSPMLGALEGLLLSFLSPEERAAANAAGVELTDEILARLASHLIACAASATAKGDDWEPIVSRFVEPLGPGSQEMLATIVRDAESR